MNSLTSFIHNLTTLPGVYSMIDVSGQVIYVGKAKNLKKRVSSYFQRQLDNKTLSLVKQIHSIEVTVTRNEREALLLESNLIKNLKPRYNIIFRDDKSYPYLYLSTQDPFPRLSFHRGEKASLGKYYGPYPSAREARDALAFLQGMFKLRQCDNAFFKSRIRPCLQYQIKRCSAPCVGYITKEIYQQDVDNVVLFLEGKSDAVIVHIIKAMEHASEQLDYERAARFRDQIALLRKIQEQQIIVGTKEDIDVLGIYFEGGLACVHLLVVRQGRMLGSRHYFPNTRSINLWVEEEAESSAEEELFSTFMMQHYLKPAVNGLPTEILVPFELKQGRLLEEILGEQSKHRIRIRKPVRGLHLKWLNMAMQSAREALKNKLLQKQDLSNRFEALQEALQLESIPERLECFDVSHTLGESTVASCVVFDVAGPVKNDYRRFNIHGVTKGDDYGALRQAITRRYTRLKSEDGVLPDVLFIDGGRGQLNQALAVLDELQVTDVIVLGVSKGQGRKPGLETLHRASGETLNLPSNSHALHLIQHIRDEAHRFAITAHRKQQRKKRIRSRLEDIPGIGAERRLVLLNRFGGLQEVSQATIEDLAKVPGISRTLAERIYEALHGS